MHHNNMTPPHWDAEKKQHSETQPVRILRTTNHTVTSQVIFHTDHTAAMMMLRSFLLLSSLLVAAQSFSPSVRVTPPSRIPLAGALQVSHLDCHDAVTTSRRSALATGLLALVTLPVVVAGSTAANAAVSADESAEDMVERIAAKSAAANAAARAKAAAEEQKKIEGADSGKILVPAFLLGSVGLSLPFFLPNLIRLGTKVASGGEDDGYGKKRK